MRQALPSQRLSARLALAFIASGLLYLLLGQYMYGPAEGTIQREIQQALASNNVNLPRPVVSLASTVGRSNELVATLHSLVQQSLAAREIRVYLAEDNQNAFERFVRDTPNGNKLQLLMQAAKGPPIRIKYVKDVGPASKFVDAIQELLDANELDVPLVIVDDDHYYSPDLLSSLAFYASLPFFRNASVGLRGWRIREDLQWGANQVNAEEYNEHVIESHHINQPYRASVLTANDAYLIHPRWFRRQTSGDAKTAAGLLDLAEMASTQAHLVDDIWMAGNLCVARIPKYVVPLDIGITGSSALLRPYRKISVPSVDIARHAALEAHMQAEGHNRWEANNAALHLFEDAWRQEGLYYVLMEHRDGKSAGHPHPLTRVPFELASRVSIYYVARKWLLQRVHYFKAVLMFSL